MLVGVLKIGHGNIRSLINTLEKFGCDVELVSCKKEIEGVDKLILPGVGSFFSVMSELKNKNLVEPIQQHAMSKDILGVCLGMQLMMKNGTEGGDSNGLGLINGSVKLLPKELGRLPHVGWNDIYSSDENQLMKGVTKNSNVYFVHSYECIIDESISIIYSDFYNKNFVAGFQKNNIFGTQFHPEKSQNVGNSIIKNFLDHSYA
jgi:imidazole glycerol-phosphate synthase subunit HisH